ncbi:MAG: winged helix-turn-helix transcriptional regulator [Succiniclasticum sp.]|uniref:winged helix-turn-helix transcriptional regulator n=1 Tax=Succiniclasticum sp. TaxID=2775030 RepID=UPI002A91ED20|nr:winged helix-turn-helix transcriptional regulator [Succiniclasticum sp.]MDY6292210.1 winged helix-turn-helix transcriptional regulator [Succiniclasticum sp.]
MVWHNTGNHLAHKRFTVSYIADADNQTLRYRELERKVVGITATMLTKCLRELEQDGLVRRKQYNTIPPTVEYSLTENGKALIPALESVYQWADAQMKVNRREGS